MPDYQESLTSKQIKAALTLAGIKNVEIAKRLGVSQSLISNVIAGRYRSRRVEEELVSLGIPSEVFGTAKRRGRPKQ